MDDFTPQDMGADDENPLAALFRALTGGGSAPDPAEVRRHEMSHLTDDLGVDQDMAVRFHAILEEQAGQRQRFSTMTAEDWTTDMLKRAALAEFANSCIRPAFDAIHRCEAMGIPLDAVLNVEDARGKIRLLVDAWAEVTDAVVDTLSVAVPDDISSLTD